MSSVLEKINFDIACNITSYLNYEEGLRLSLTCSEWRFWLHQEEICRVILRSHAKYTLEAQSLHDKLCTGRAAFQRLYKRRTAVSVAKPFSILSFGVVTAFVYSLGVLSILKDDKKIYIVDVHGSTRNIPVVDLTTLVEQHLTCDDVGIRIFSCFGKVVVLLIRDKSLRTSWLLAVRASSSQEGPPIVLMHHEVQSTAKIFVRQCETHVVYGCQPPPVFGTERFWKIIIIDLTDSNRADASHGHATMLYSSFGANVGIDAAFEIYGRYLYGVSTKMASKLVDGDWLSFFDCIRVPLDGIGDLELCQVPRRRFSEGPLHDAWTTLQLEEDEQHGELTIVESRREWVNGSSRLQRSCYVHPLRFPEGEAPDFVHEPDWRAFLPEDTRYIHHDSDVLEFKATRTKYKTYNLSAKSFLDLVSVGTGSEGLLQSHSKSQTKLRLRVSCFHDLDGEPPFTVYGRTEPMIKSSMAPKLWPQDDAPAEVIQLMDSLDNCESDIHAVADERSLAFMAGSKGSSEKQLVLINFDPSIHLPGVETWYL